MNARTVNGMFSRKWTRGREQCNSGRYGSGKRKNETRDSVVAISNIQQYYPDVADFEVCKSRPASQAQTLSDRDSSKIPSCRSALILLNARPFPLAL